MRRTETRLVLALALLTLAACGSPTPPATLTAVAPPTPPQAPTAGPSAVAEAPPATPTFAPFDPFGDDADLPPDRRSSQFPDVFPQATMAVQGGSTAVWSAWPMEGHDPLRSGRASANGPTSATVRWSVEVGGASYGQVVQAADETLYLGTDGGEVVALTASGAPRWRYGMPSKGPVPTPAVRPDGLVLARASDGTIVGLKPDGTRAWTTDIGGDGRKLGPALLVGPDRYAYTTSYFSSLVYRLQPGGFFQWANNLQARTLAGPAVRPDGVVYAGAEDGTLRAISAQGGQVWSVKLPGPVIAPPSVDAQERAFVVVGGSTPQLVAVEADGTERWRAPACWQAGPAIWPATDAQGTVVVGNCAIRGDGSLAWRVEVDARATPAVVDGTGNAYFGAGNVLHAVGPNGRPRWSWQADSELRPPSLGTGGTLYVASASRVYALGP